MRAARDTSDVTRDLVSLLPRLRRFALTLTRSSHDADDLVQEICARAVAQMPEWSGSGRLESWLYTMMQSAWIDDTRKKTRFLPANADGPELGAVAKAADAGDPLGAAILSMPDETASLFLLIAIEKHSYREAGDIMGLPEGSVAHHMAAARRCLLKIAAISEKGL